MKNINLAITQDQIVDHLDSIKSLFKTEARPRITVVVRNEAVDDGDIVISDDDFNKVVDAIRKAQTR